MKKVISTIKSTADDQNTNSQAEFNRSGSRVNPLPDPCADSDDEAEADGYKMSERDKIKMDQKLAQQKDQYEAQLNELRADKALLHQLEHKNRELTKALEDRKKSQVCIIM